MNIRSKKSILVVDDEEIIREFLTEVLGDDYDVSLAEDGDVAIAKIGSESFDLIITDMKMPNVSGEEVVKFVAQERPGTPVIVISGYSTLHSFSQSASHGAVAFLSKPFSIVDLTKTVDEQLESHA